VSEPDFTIPDDQLPAGFAEDVERTHESPVFPRPAATVVLVRDAGDRLEALLLRRTRKSAFVPGAYVFPGGRVDPDDAHADVIARLDGLTPDQAGSRLAVEGQQAIGYYLAAVREAFEETGLLIGRSRSGESPTPAARSETVESLRRRLLEGRISFAEVLEEMECRIAGDRIEYIAHWITPVQEPRRYDTRFFLAAVAGPAEPVLDEREMTDSRWITPAEALNLHGRGQLPMVFPTIKTLEALAPYSNAAAAAAAFRAVEIPSILPRLVRTPTGVGIEIPEQGDADGDRDAGE
jgi:8-oxo-dGTP pyrophosphatase MutT (NUDIX family)